MTFTPDSAPEIPEPVGGYQHEYWYNLNGHDWQFVDPQPLSEFLPALAEYDDVPVHFLRLFVEYGTLDEAPEDEGVLATFCFLLRQFLRVSEPAGVDLRERDFVEGMPRIDVTAGMTLLEVELAGTDVARLAAVWELLAQALDDPKCIYRSEEAVMGGASAVAVRDAQIMSTALQRRGDVVTPALWHNDLTLRTGVNGATLAPLDVSHHPHRMYPAISRVAALVNPMGGKTRHSLLASSPELMGVGFTRPPAPMSVEDLLAEPAPLAFPQAGFLETDDGQALMSAAFPLSPAGIIASVVFGNIVAQLLHEAAGERAELRGELYARGDEVVFSLAAAGDWSVEDGRALLEELVVAPGNVPVFGEERLPDHRLAGVIDSFKFSVPLQHLLMLRRVEAEIATPELVRSLLERAFGCLHVAEPLVRGRLRDVFEPLVPEHLMLLSYGCGDGRALPPALDVDDLTRSFHEVDGEHFVTRCVVKDQMPLFVPHRLSISDELIAAEWYEDGRAESPLRRRIALAWDEVAAWETIGEAIALMDIAGRVLFFVPTLFDRVGELYELLKVRERALAVRGVPILSGGERELRAHVRKIVGYCLARERRAAKRRALEHVEGNVNPYGKAARAQLAEAAAKSKRATTVLAVVVAMVVLGLRLWNWGSSAEPEPAPTVPAGSEVLELPKVPVFPQSVPEFLKEIKEGSTQSE